MKNKVTASLAPIQWSGHWAHDYKMVYCRRKLLQFITGNLDVYTVAHK